MLNKAGSILRPWHAWSTLFLLSLGYLMDSTPVHGQTTVLEQPDCQVFFTLTASGNGTRIDNRYTGCTFWSVSFNNTGFSALTLAVQSAPNSSGVPGTFVTFAGTTVSGSNPSTSTTSASWIGTGYYPFVRVNLSGTTGSGTVSGNLYGWRQRPSTSTSSGGCADPCTVVQPTAANLNATVVGSGTAGTPAAGTVTVQGITSGTPIQIQGRVADGATSSGNPVPVSGVDASGNTQVMATMTTGRPIVQPSTSGVALADALSNTVSLPAGSDTADSTQSTVTMRTVPSVFNGSTWDRSYKCDQSAAFDITATTTELVALASSQNIRVCHVSAGGSAASDIKLVRGTGTNCGTGTTNVTGTYKAISALALDFVSPSPLVITASNALCLTVTTGTWGGVIIYAKF